MLSFEEGIVNSLKEKVFTIENKEDPTWEQMCQNIAEEFIKNFLKINKYKGELFAKLKSLKDTNEIQKLLKSYNIELPTAPKTEQGVLEIFKDKIKVMNEWRIENLLEKDFIYKLSTSGIITNAVLNVCLDRDCGYNNLGASSEVCVGSDRKMTIPVCDSYAEFINNCKDAHIDSVNQLTGYVDGEKVNITIKFDNENKMTNAKIDINCISCGKSFTFDFAKVSNTEKTIYIRCPHCNTELKRGNINYKSNSLLLKDILDEFVIKQFGDDYFVFATDKAYKMLGYNEKENILTNGIIVDTMNNMYYRLALISFLKSEYRIDGLIRTSRGNSHDANWQKEIMIFNNGGLWQEELDKYDIHKNVLYENENNVKHYNEINDDLIEEWIKDYNLSGNGEDTRYAFCSFSDGSGRFCFAFESCYSIGTASSRKSNKSGCYTGAGIYLKQIKN